MKLKKDKVKVFINQKGGKQIKAVYPSFASGASDKSDAEINKALERGLYKSGYLLYRNQLRRNLLYTKKILSRVGSLLI